MSIQQLQFQLKTCLCKLQQSAITIFMTYHQLGLHLIEPKSLRSDSNFMIQFRTEMELKRPDAVDIFSEAVHCANKIYHHSELISKASIGRINRGGSFWNDVFNKMIELTYIHIDMYDRSDKEDKKPRRYEKYEMSKSIGLIEEMLEKIVYYNVTTEFVAVPLGDTVPLTLDNLELVKKREVRRNVRRAPSAIESVIEEEPQQKGSPVGGSNITSYTHNGVMKVQIPASEIKKRRS